jgi:hypothetical protein
MFNRRLFYLAVLVTTASAFSGCGTQYAGTYQGQETVALQGASQNYAVTMQLSQSGSSVSGSYTSASGQTGTLTGTTSGNSLTNVNLAMNGGSTTTYYSGQTCSLAYTAPVLAFTNNQLSGTFSINSTTLSTTTSYCPSTSLATSRQLVANKTN